MAKTGLGINRIHASANSNGTTTITMLNVDPQTRDRSFFGNFQLPGIVEPDQAVVIVESRADERNEPVPTRSWGRTAVECCIMVSDDQFNQHVEQVEVTAQALAPELAPNQVAA